MAPDVAGVAVAYAHVDDVGVESGECERRRRLRCLQEHDRDQELLVATKVRAQKSNQHVSDIMPPNDESSTNSADVTLSVSDRFARP